jgi:hypothetical protein
LVLALPFAPDFAAPPALLLTVDGILPSVMAMAADARKKSN